MKDHILSDKLELIKPIIESNGLACTIGNEDLENQSNLMGKIKQSIKEIITEKTKESIILKFEMDKILLRTLLDFSIKEQECCSFLNFAIEMKKSINQINYEISSEEMEFQKLDAMIMKIFKD